MDKIREFQFDYFLDDWMECDRVSGIGGFMLVNTLKCVQCGSRSYEESKGKSSRTLDVICQVCIDAGKSVVKEVPNAPAKNEQRPK